MKRGWAERERERDKKKMNSSRVISLKTPKFMTAIPDPMREKVKFVVTWGTRPFHQTTIYHSKAASDYF